MGRYNIRLESVVLALTIVFVVLLGLDLIGRDIPVLRPVVGILLFAALPGAVVLRIVGVNPEDTRIWILYSVGVSLVMLMAIGLILNLLLPLVGVDRPLAPIPLTVPYVIGFSIFAGWGLSTGSVSPIKIRVPTRLEKLRFAQMVAVLLPILSVLAVTTLNVGRVKLPMIAFLILLSIIPVVVVAGFVKTVDLTGLVLGVSLAILWHKSLWTEDLFGGHASVIGIFDSGYWSVSGETLLVNAILMPALSRLLGIEILTQVKVVMPVLIALIPLALFVAFDRYTTPKAAFLGAALFMFAHPFYLQYPSTPRASFPVLFLSLIGVVIADGQTARIHRRGLSVLFGAGVVVSHYGTSYYVLFATVGVVVGLYLMRTINTNLHRGSDEDKLSGVSTSEQPRFIQLLDKRHKSSVFNRSYVVFYSVAALGWYFYVDGGSKFDILASQILQAFVSLFIEGGGQGSTTERVVTDYGSQSIRLSKYLYFIFALLIGIGILVSIVRWFINDGESMFSDEHLTMSALLLALFGVAAAVSGAWGGGRPLMIVLSFCAIFPLVMLSQCVNAVRWTDRRASKLIRGDNPVTLRGGKNGAMLAFAVLLASLFVINAGVISAVAFGGNAPSSVLDSDPDIRDANFDIQTHAWFTDHRNEQYQVYGDNTVYRQATDWINGEVAARTEVSSSYRFRPKFDLNSINDSVVEPGYVVLVSHNIREDRVAVDYINSRPIRTYELSLDQRNRVYTNGLGETYYNPKRFNTSSVEE